jgi:hypothetical protein
MPSAVLVAVLAVAVASVAWATTVPANNVSSTPDRPAVVVGLWTETHPGVTQVTAATRACLPPHNTFPFCDTSLDIPTRVKVGLVWALLAPLLFSPSHHPPRTATPVRISSRA